MQVVGLSLSFAWAFSAIAQWSPSSVSLLEGLQRRWLAMRERRAAQQEAREAIQRDKRLFREQSLAMQRLGQQARQQATIKTAAQQRQPGSLFRMRRPKAQSSRSMDQMLGKVDHYLARLAEMEVDGDVDSPSQQSNPLDEANDHTGPS